ncbi:translation initiation factor IF-2 [Clostridia bacterium]|nr:translation initiation factor IF-2 [Clostridia bacterium]
MSIKIHELAKELDISSKELLGRAVAMGIDAKSHMSTIDDIEALTVKNAIIHENKAVETKIVKVAPKTEKKKHDPVEEPRVVVKAVAKANPGVKPKPTVNSATKSRPAENRPPQKPPQGIAKRVEAPRADNRTAEEKTEARRDRKAHEHKKPMGTGSHDLGEMQRIPRSVLNSEVVETSVADNDELMNKPFVDTVDTATVIGETDKKTSVATAGIAGEKPADEKTAEKVTGKEVTTDIEEKNKPYESESDVWPGVKILIKADPNAKPEERSSYRRNDNRQSGSSDRKRDDRQGNRSDRPDNRQQGGNRADGRPDRPGYGAGGNRQDGRPDNRQQGGNRADGRPDRPGYGAGGNRQDGRPDNRPQGGNRLDGRPDRPGYGSGGNRPDGRPDNRPQGGNRPDGRPDRPGYGAGGNRQDGRPDRPGYGAGGNRQDGRPDRPGYGAGGNRQDGRPDRPGYGAGGNRQDGRPDRPGYGTGGNRADGRPDRPGYGTGGNRQDGRPEDRGSRPTERYPKTDSRTPKTADGRPGRPDDRTSRPASTAGKGPKDFAKKKDGRVEVKKAPDKERDKYSGLKRKEVFVPERSLEKRPLKNRNRPKPVKHVVEEDDNLMNLAPGTKVINVPITVAGLAEQIEKTTSEIIMRLMRLGIMANINQNIDEDTVLVLAEELGVQVVIGNVSEDVQDEGLDLFEDSEEDLKPRPPIITVMGHVDHGKTSLLDAIRKTNVTQGEAGGITQHIGASEVTINGEKIVFLDTPGHEAFTAMRARGAHVTDIAVLVVAADDGVKPQTIESISHAKAAGVPVIVAINKIDKPGANLDRVKQELSDHNILVEEWGGTTICVPVSAKSGEGIVTLLEMILLQAEVLELKANPERLALGTVIEARLDKAKGPVATLLVLNGKLESGMSIVAGTSSGRIRAMTDYQGNPLKSAGPATAVEILGLTDVPEAGDEFNAVKDDKLAREIAQNRWIKLREEVMVKNSSTTLEKLFSQIQEGVIKELPLIIKGDVQGSVGALTASLEKLKNENVVVKIVHTGVGTVTESDVMLASTAGAIIIAFNVRPSTAVVSMAEREGVEIRNYRIIYEVIDEVEAAMKGMLDPVFKEVVLGKAEIRNTFRVPGIGVIAGSYVTDGKVQRNMEIRLVRDGIVIHEGKISSLKRFKDDVKDVAQGYECGIGIENYNDLKEGDEIEVFTMEEIKR